MHQRHFDANLFGTLIDQVEGAATAGGGMGNVSKWICANTRDPLDPNKPFSLKGHEYMRGILDDQHPVVSTKKCTQIGLTELSIRQALAILAKFRNISCIYVMPTVHAAQKIASTRIDPVIDASPRLSALVSKDVDSTLLKKIGHGSFLHLAGAATEKAGISTPARALLVDEKEWCDPAVISVFMSRLGHQAEQDRIIRFFSSPLFPKSGITADFEAGTRNHYMVFHRRCGHWVLPNLLIDLILPGYDENITLLAPSDLDNPKYDVNAAYVRCPKCRHPITTENLADPECRAWVPEYPDREAGSYNANALVLPHIRTPPRLFRDLKLYGDNVTWQRFSLGEAAEGANEMILHSVIENCFKVRPQAPLSGTVTGALLGMDIGKISHLAVGKMVGRTLEVFHLEKILQDGSNNTKTTFVERYKQFRAVQAVVDHGPDLTIPKSIQADLPYNQVWPCFFIRGKGKSSLTPYELDEVEGVIKANRTRTIDEFVAAMNNGYIKLPAGTQFEDEVKSHLQQLKRITNKDGVGEEQAVWTSTSDENHWFFAVYYLFLASKLVEDNTKIYVVPASSMLVSKVRLGATASAYPH